MVEIAWFGQRSFEFSVQFSMNRGGNFTQSYLQKFLFSRYFRVILLVFLSHTIDEFFYLLRVLLRSSLVSAKKEVTLWLQSEVVAKCNLVIKEGENTKCLNLHSIKYSIPKQWLRDLVRKDIEILALIW